MKHFLLPRGFDGGPSLVLSGRDFHYLTRVLRKAEGETLPAVSVGGARFLMRIERIDRASCLVGIAPAEGGETAETPGSGASIHLLQCLPKGAKMDLIVRQAVEAGVEEIVPVVSARTVAAPDGPARRLARWRRIAREALQQSGNDRLPAIGEPITLAGAAALDRRGGLGLVFHQERIAEGSLHAALARAPSEGQRVVYILIGPEGGLAGDEVETLRGAGFRPVHLGDTVLRTETAALYAIAAVKTILRERDAWTLSE